MPLPVLMKIWQLLVYLNRFFYVLTCQRLRMRNLCLLFICFMTVSACAHKVVSQPSERPVQNLSFATLPPSQINVPISINLKSLYALAEKNVDTVFTSPHYPADWVQSDCATRYKYHFRRSPLKMSMTGNTLNLNFTGYYKIIGSTRACVSGTVLSPWTPACQCGFDEGERRVNIGYTATFALLPNEVLKIKVMRLEPKPLDKCNVCFWGQDVTASVMTGLKAELDLSKKAIEDSFGLVNLKPYLQQAWNKLSDVYALPNLGYLSVKPVTLRMENITASNDLLHINLGITATPAISFIKPESVQQTVPDLAGSATANGFNINLEAALQYDSLSKVINGYLAGKRFELSEGFIKKHIVINHCKVYNDGSDKLQVSVAFGGSFNGTVYFTGKPVYHEDLKKIEMQDFDYDLKTKDFLLKTAKWLFDKQIVTEIKKYTVFDLSAYYNTAATTIDAWLNKEWTKGIKGSGTVNDLKLTGVYAMPQHLLIRSNCTGNLNVLVSQIDLTL